MRRCIKEEVPRDAAGAPCFCGGYGDEQKNKPTKEEIDNYDCGKGYSCCTGVFKCRICGEEFISKLEAPYCG